uniref:Inducible T-cell costimulator n=2 Tax=Monodelphis domestica TaxID=13616 RepID=F6QZ18_MONDO
MKSDWVFLFVCFRTRRKKNFNDSAQLMVIEFYNGGLKLSCHYPEAARDFKMQLLKGTGKQKVCELKKENQDVQMTKELVSCQPKLSNTSVIFFLTDLDSTHTGHYFCSLHVTYPPPFLNSTPNGAYLHIYESKSCFHMSLWLSLGVAFSLCFIGILIGVFSNCIRKKISQSRSSLHETNSEYMPMAAVNAAKNPGFKGGSQFGAFFNDGSFRT